MTRYAVLLCAERKSAFVAYLMLIALGGLGGHRFYLGQTDSAIPMLCITLATISLAANIDFQAGFDAMALGGPASIDAFVEMAMVATGSLSIALWVLADIFRIPGMVSRRNRHWRS